MGTKILTGATTSKLRDNQFSFGVKADEANPAAGVDQSELKLAVGNKADGTIDFGKLTFTAEGEWSYTIRENTTSTATMQTDGSVYIVKFKVEDIEHNGKLTVNRTITKQVTGSADTTVEAIVFINTALATPTPTPTVTPPPTPTPTPPVTPTPYRPVNTPTPTPEPEKVTVSGGKTWNDNGNEDGMRPASITVSLLADGTVVDSATASEANGWSWSFGDLDKYRADGETEIVYSISEQSVPYYTSTVNGYDVVNTYQRETTSATITKVWDDDNNKDGMRPASIQVSLSNGATVTLSESNGWSATVNDLPVYRNGQRVTYTWSEQSVLGYVQTGSVTTGTSTVITNSLHKPTTPGNPTPHSPYLPTPDETKAKRHGKPTEFIDDYETPLGLGVIINHVGDCYE